MFGGVILNGKIIVRSFLDERGRVASRRGCEWCDTRSPKSSRTRNEPRVESESSEREPFVRLSDRALPLNFGTGLLERVGTGIVGTIGYVVLPTGVSTDVSRDIV